LGRQELILRNKQRVRANSVLNTSFNLGKRSSYTKERALLLTLLYSWMKPVTLQYRKIKQRGK